MTILETALCNLKDELMSSGYFNRLYEYAELLTSDEKTYPQVYQGKGQYKAIYDFDVNGSGYIRKTGSVYSDHVTEIKLVGCSDINPLIDLAFPLRLVVAVPKSKLGDNSFSDDSLVFALMQHISKKHSAIPRVNSVHGKVTSYVTDRERVWNDEVSGVEKTIDLTLSFVSIDFTITFRVPLDCLEQICEY